MNIFLIKSRQSHHLQMNQLIFIFPISNFTLMIIKAILIIVEISQGLTIIKHHSLTAVDIWRTVVADDIQHNFDACTVTRINQLFQRWTIPKYWSTLQPSQTED